MARDLSTPNVWSYTQSPFAHFDYQVFIDVQNIDSKLGDTVSLDVLWTIKPKAKKPTHTVSDGNKSAKSSGLAGGKQQEITGRSVVHERVTGEGFEPLVAAQSRAFDQVSHAIARAIHQ